MSDSRYIRHEQLKGFGPQGQAKLNQAKVLVVGLGGLGLPVAQYLTALGVGTIGLVDQDTIELHNLQRQVLYDESDVGKSKLEVSKHKLQLQNSQITIDNYDSFLTKDNALEICKGYDVVVDATDNFPTRYLINDVCVLLNKPFVYGALHGFEGQVSVFNHNDGPTYRCLFPEMPKAQEIPNCDENGILGVLPGIIGTLQVLETVKLLSGVGTVLSGMLLVYDGLTQSTQKISFDTIPENKKIKKLKKSYDFDGCLNAPSIKASEFISLSERQHMQLIDVRSVDEFAEFHWDGSKNIPLPLLAQQTGTIDFDRPIYLVCQSGKRSEIALNKLMELHPKANIRHILGGLNQLKQYVVGSR